MPESNHRLPPVQAGDIGLVVVVSPEMAEASGSTPAEQEFGWESSH